MKDRVETASITTTGEIDALEKRVSKLEERISRLECETINNAADSLVNQQAIEHLKVLDSAKMAKTNKETDNIIKESTTTLKISKRWRNQK